MSVGGFHVKFIPDTVDRMDWIRFRIGRFYLSSQFLDMAVDGTVADNPFVRIDPVHELLPGEDTAPVDHEELEKLELNCRQIEIAARPCCLVA